MPRIDVAPLRPRLAAALGEQFRLGDLLGEGGFAAVFRAHDTFLQRDVAIKVLDPSITVDSEREEQFLHEARTIAAAEHPHIVPLYSAESKMGLLYLVMRLLPGQSLESRIAAGKLAPADAARIALECARALAAAHAVGVIHRDIKPSNILLDQSGNAAITDFGIALVTTRPGREFAGTTAGTPHYMSPEQALGEPVDGRSDVYALGVVLFEMLTGMRPFTGRNETEVVAQHISAPIPGVSEKEPATPSALAALVGQLLAKNPAQRPTASELVNRLMAASTPEALRTPAQVQRRRWSRRALYVAIAALGAVPVIVVAIGLFSRITTFMAGGSEGPEPALVASGEAIPDSIVQLARVAGVVEPDERILFVFVSAGRTFEDALVITDSALIRTTPGGTIRRSRSASNVNLQPLPRGRSAGGLLIVHERGAAPDTFYKDLNGREGFHLMQGFMGLPRSQRPRDSTPR